MPDLNEGEPHSEHRLYRDVKWIDAVAYGVMRCSAYKCSYWQCDFVGLPAWEVAVVALEAPKARRGHREAKYAT